MSFGIYPAASLVAYISSTSIGIRTWISKYIHINSEFIHCYSSVKLSIAYRQVSNIRRTLVVNYIVDHSDVVGASPVGAAPTTSSFST